MMMSMTSLFISVRAVRVGRTGYVLYCIASKEGTQKKKKTIDKRETYISIFVSGS